MKLLGYCLFCLLAARVQSKPQTTKLFPLERTDEKQLSNTTRSLENFWGKLRATYSFILGQPNNTSNVEKILKDTPISDLQALKLIWTDTIKTDKYANLPTTYPNNSFLDQLKSLSTLQNYEIKANSSNLKKESSVKIATTIKANETNVSSEEQSSNKTEILLDDDWFNDVQPLEQLELQDEEINKKNEVEIVTVSTTTQSPSKGVGYQLVDWLGSLFSITHSIYAKLSAACAN